MDNTALWIVLAFLGGALVGTYGYYRYANHMYMEYPEFFKLVLDRKIERRRQRGVNG